MIHTLLIPDMHVRSTTGHVAVSIKLVYPYVRNDITSPNAPSRERFSRRPLDQLTLARMTKSVLSNVTREDIARLERELATTQQRTRSVEESYGIDNLTLTVTKTYLAKLLRSTPINTWLGKNRPDFLAEFQSIAEISSLNSANPIAGSITGMKPTSKRAVHRQPLA